MEAGVYVDFRESVNGKDVDSRTFYINAAVLVFFPNYFIGALAANSQK